MAGVDMAVLLNPSVGALRSALAFSRYPYQLSILYGSDVGVVRMVKRIPVFRESEPAVNGTRLI